MRLNVSPPPPPSILKQSRRTLTGIPAISPVGLRSAPPLPPRAKPNVDADWDDEKEDDVTDVYAERATLVFKRDGTRDDETTRELPWPSLRRMPAPPPMRSSSPPPLPPRARAAPGASVRPVPLPPTGFDTISASLAAASLPPPGFAVALARENEARAPRRLEGPSLRVAGALTVAAVVVLVAFGRRPAQGKIVVDASDFRGAPVSRLDVFVDGERTVCDVVPCLVRCARGLHEVKVIAEGFEAPATQGVAVASGDPTAVHFIVSPSRESGVDASGPQDRVKLEPIAVDDGKTSETYTATPDPKPIATPAGAPTAHAPRTTPSLPAYPVPVAPAAKASRARSGGAAVRDAYLNINSLPASTCFLDGRSLGSTPRLRVEVSAGSHTVKFRAPDSGSIKTVVVNVGVGETRLAVARLN